ncbi:hypothetical protein U9M48_012747 [Paspalum notatum var. saurae]|uniref:Uncharacterized protein n=1 Tax=Paspalum notatum var. saurae TaxID=547442 RepID=A0AAQ3SZ32_PASNO
MPTNFCRRPRTRSAPFSILEACFDIASDTFSNVCNISSKSIRQLNHARRMVLVKSVLTSQATYLLTALRAPKATLKDIDAKRKQFLWSGNERLTGGKCKVNWTRTARSKKNGGLGILHLGKFARALRLRWLWREWFAEDKPWIGAQAIRGGTINIQNFKEKE